MSFILDALKKSERERERQQQPAVLELPYGRRNRSPPLWLMIVIGLLVVNFVLLLVMWWRSGQSLTPSTTSADTSTSASSAPISNAQGSSAPIITPPRTSDVRPLQSEAGVEAEPALDENALLAEDELPAEEPLVRPLSNLERAVAQQELSANAQRARSPGGAPTSSNITDSTPTLASLGGSGALNLPELRLDVHVYSSVASERFAFINTRKYAEGQTLAEGPRLEKIAQDGVILSYRNQRFLVPRN